MSVVPHSLLCAEHLEINWSEGEEDDICETAKDMVQQLLCHNPDERLGSSIRGGGLTGDGGRGCLQSCVRGLIHFLLPHLFPLVSSRFSHPTSILAPFSPSLPPPFLLPPSLSSPPPSLLASFFLLLSLLSLPSHRCEWCEVSPIF